MKPFYITTSIAYPNANPHIGYALELVQADFLARYHRLKGEEVYFLSGLDVHGLKIQRTAEQTGVSPEAFVDEKGDVFKKLVKDYSISLDRFIKTNDEDHKKMAQALWRMCADNGDIYKKRYQAWYNVKEEEFLGMVDENPDPSIFGIDPRFLEKIDEENYFFALSRYSEKIVGLLKSGAYKVAPASRLQELLNFVEQKGLQDVSISREQSKLGWGVPVPDDDSQVMYVWYDALTNYLTPVSTVDGRKIVTGPTWAPSLHCIGKDISRFHALLWPGMLMSAGIELPKELLVHGFITSAGQKMSKSIGNVIDPFEAMEKYGADAVRWYLLKEVPTTGDADFTYERLESVYNADLANDLGNLISRVWTMCLKYADGSVPTAGDSTGAQELVESAWISYFTQVEGLAINNALQSAHDLLVYSNKRIDEQKPWALAKDPERKVELDALLYELLEVIRNVLLMIAPAMPNVVDKAAAAVFPNLDSEVWVSFKKGARWGVLESCSKLGSESLILFPKHIA